MDWIRRNFMAIIVLAAVVISFGVGIVEADRKRADDTAQSVKLCTLSNERSALSSAYIRRTAEARRSTGDVAIARDYDAFANGVVRALAVAPMLADPNVAAQVRLIDTDTGPAYELTGPSKELIAQGCENALGD